MSEREPGAGDVFLSFLLGGMIGAVLGLLFAPCSGEELRRRLKKLSEEFKEDSEDIIREIKERTDEYMEENREKLFQKKKQIEAALEAGKRAYHKKRKD